MVDVFRNNIDDEEGTTPLIALSSYTAKRMRQHLRKNFAIASLLFGINHGTCYNLYYASSYPENVMGFSQYGSTILF